MRHQFRMGAPFELGIQYFSRREEGLARQKALAKQQPTHRMSLDLRSNDTETVDLILRARREINAWRKAQVSIERPIKKYDTSRPTWRYFGRLRGIFPSDSYTQQTFCLQFSITSSTR